MIYSRALEGRIETPERRPEAVVTPVPEPPPSAVVLDVTFDTPFGSPWSEVRISAVDEETGEIVAEKKFSVDSYKARMSDASVSSRIAEMKEDLRSKGYEKIKIKN